MIPNPNCQRKLASFCYSWPGVPLLAASVCRLNPDMPRGLAAEHTRPDESTLSGERCGAGSEPVSPCRPLRLGSGAASATVQQCRPRNGLGQGGHLAQHDLNEVPDGIGGIFGPPRTFQPAIDKQLQQIESQRPKQQDGQQSIRRVSKHVGEVPVLDPLVEGGILEVPASTNDLQRRPACKLARTLTEDGKTPTRRLFVGLGDGGPDHTHSSLVGGKRIDLVR